MKMESYVVPFHIENGVILDREGKQVKLWGVNYHVPFNHNYCNILELGKDHFKAIDTDLRHFHLMGINLIRIHLYDREITDRVGNIVENRQMKVFDYLIEQCEKLKIFLQITPITWWNTVKNELVMKESYAYWHIDPADAFGFSNFYSKDAMLWHPDAIKAQKTYLHSLFSRKNAFSGKMLSEYENLIFIEPFNEMNYLDKKGFDYWILERRNTETSSGSRGSESESIIGMWMDFLKKHAEESEPDELFRIFQRELLDHYLSEIIPVIEEKLGNRVIKAKYAGTADRTLFDIMKKHGIQAVSYNGYLTSQGFDSANANNVNFLPLTEAFQKEMLAKDISGLSRICYEYNAVSTGNGYPLAALAVVFAEMQIQSAAYFTYTPDAVAAWNPGWLTHYFNLQHTPSRAACFAVAGEIFRSHSPGESVMRTEKEWHGKNFRIQVENDLVWFKNEKVFRYSNDNAVELGDISSLESVSGRGSSKFAECSGNGFYALEKISAGVWSLHIFPSQHYLMVPERIPSNRFMANRFISCISEPPVSQLLETNMEFRLVPLHVKSVVSADGSPIPVSQDGFFSIPPGEYRIETEILTHNETTR